MMMIGMMRMRMMIGMMMMTEWQNDSVRYYEI
jgi:hypothetical protein